MMRKAWSRIAGVPSCFSMSSVKFQGHTAKTTCRFSPKLGIFQTLTPVWVRQWLRNDVQSLNQHRRGALLFLNVIRQISRSHGSKIADFDMNWAFLDCKVSFDVPMALKLCTKLEVARAWYPIVFQGHQLNFKVTRDKKHRFWPKLIVSEL